MRARKSARRTNDVKGKDVVPRGTHKKGNAKRRGFYF
jgi:hypothetical protein